MVERRWVDAHEWQKDIVGGRMHGRWRHTKRSCQTFWCQQLREATFGDGTGTVEWKGMSGWESGRDIDVCRTVAGDRRCQVVLPVTHQPLHVPGTTMPIPIATHPILISLARCSACQHKTRQLRFVTLYPPYIPPPAIHPSTRHTSLHPPCIPPPAMHPSTRHASRCHPPMSLPMSLFV